MGIFEKGNKAAEKWNEEESIKVFEDCLTKALKDNDILSIDDVMIYALKKHNLPISTFKYLINKFPVLASLKESIVIVIRSRINKGGLKGDFNPTMCIWRQKQLGESDPDKVKNINLIDNLKIEIVEDDESEDKDKN